MRIVAVLAVIAFAACQTPTPEKTATPDAPKAEPEKAKAETPAAEPTPASIGKKAPDFTLANLEGEEVSLASFAGKTVVLEWFNPDCPFVKYSHNEGPLAEMAVRAMKDNEELVWLAVNSGAPGKQGHGVERNQAAMQEYGMSYDVLVDEDGSVGKRYGAKTTPHMYVIDSEGTLVYAGALDNAPMGKVQGDEMHNYVAKALEKLAAGEDIDPKETKPYGCSVKYGS